MPSRYHCGISCKIPIMFHLSKAANVADTGHLLGASLHNQSKISTS